MIVVAFTYYSIYSFRTSKQNRYLVYEAKTADPVQLIVKH